VIEKGTKVKATPKLMLTMRNSKHLEEVLLLLPFYAKYKLQLPRRARR